MTRSILSAVKMFSNVVHLKQPTHPKLNKRAQKIRTDPKKQFTGALHISYPRHTRLVVVAYFDTKYIPY